MKGSMIAILLAILTASASAADPIITRAYTSALVTFDQSGHRIGRIAAKQLIGHHAKLITMTGDDDDEISLVEVATDNGPIFINVSAVETDTPLRAMTEMNTCAEAAGTHSPTAQQFGTKALTTCQPKEH